MRAFVYDRASSEIAAIRAASMLAQLPGSRAGRQVEASGRRHNAHRPDEARRHAPRRGSGPGAARGRVAHDAVSVSPTACGLGLWSRCRPPPTIRRSSNLSRNFSKLAARRKRATSQHGDAWRQRAATDPLPVFSRYVLGACNKRDPGSGCTALDGLNRQHAILGGSPDCIATYPGDFAQSLIALDATVSVAGSSGVRTIPFAALHRLPGTTPNVETASRAGRSHHRLLRPGGPLDTALALSQGP